MGLIDQNGWGNVAININGDNNTITVKRHSVQLTLSQRQKRRRDPQTDLDILDPYAQGIDLVGRKEELSNLESWLLKPQAVSIRCIIGRAGNGKTRLALELCHRADKLGWFAGFVASRDLTRFATQQNLATWRWTGSLLIVIDYAARSTEPLRTWIDELADLNPPESCRLRILLIERRADLRYGWWARLVSEDGFSNSQSRTYFDPLQPIEVKQLETNEEKSTFLSKTVDAFLRCAT